jgi:hypothetical protein
MSALISLDAKHAGERSAGNPPAPFDVAGAGNVTMAAGLRANAKVLEQPPEPTVGAPVLDPTSCTGPFQNEDPRDRWITSGRKSTATNPIYATRLLLTRAAV